MSFRTNAVKVQAFAGAMFGVQVGSTTMAQINADITSAGGLANALNGYYASSFGGATTASVAATVAANLGLTGDALAAGTAFITAQLNGAAAGARGSVISTILDQFAGLASDATFGAAATAYNAKVAAAVAYTGAANVAAGTVVATSNVFTLTASSVTGTFDNISGSSADETFSANANGLLVTGDVVTGGLGNDNISSRHTVLDPLTIGAAISGVETHFVRIDHDGAAADVFTYDMADMSGATKVVMDRAMNSGSVADAVFTISGAGFTTAVTTGIRGGDTGANNSAIDLTATYSGVSGAADTAILELNGASANVVTIAGIETLNIVALTDETSASSTGASKLNSLIAANVTTVNVTGAGAVRLSGNSNAQVAVDLAATVTVNATAATGGVSLTAETSTLTFNGSAGNDTVYMVGTLTAADTLTGGAGTDTLGVTTATSLINGAGVSGFEILDISGSNGATHVLTNYANNTFTGIAVTEETATETVNGVTSGSTLFIGGLTAITATSDITVGITGAALAGRNTDSLNVVIRGTAAVDYGTLVVANTESLSIASGGAATGNSIAVLTADKATNLTLTGASALEITAFTSTALLSNIDASAMTGAFVMGAAGANTAATAITGGSGADTLRGNAGADVIIGGAGVDTIFGGAGADDLRGGSGADIFVIAPATTNTAGSIAASATSLSSTIAVGDTMTFGNGVDIIRDFVSGSDTLQVSAATATLEGVAPTALIGALAGDIAEINVHGSRGSFVEATGVFTFNTTGSDFLLTINDGTNADDVLATSTNVIILTGVTALVAADLV